VNPTGILPEGTFIGYAKGETVIHFPRWEDVYMLTTEEIQAILPHRYPFLLVDRIVELEEGKRAVGIKNVTFNEPFFQGHFPQYAVMPGVLVVEALAQVGGVIILKQEENRGKLAFLAGINDFRFREQVRPGDTLSLEVEITRIRGTMGKGRGTAKVGEQVAAEGEILFALGTK
jgi:3-hydroxyacyl-[acyl-carrier-protein] dehydratase